MSQRSVGAWTVWAATLAVALMIVTAVVSAPLLAANGHSVAGMIVYRAFAPLCHQIPERSFHVAGLPMAVCARCLGVYGGAVAGLLIYPVLRRVTDGQAPSRWWLLAAPLPMAIDAMAGVSGLAETTFVSRTATGALAGAVVVFYILPGLVSIIGPRAPSVSHRWPA